METYSFDNPDDAQEAVKTAMAEAGCFGPDLEKSCAGKSPEKNLISSFIKWRYQKVTMRMTVTVTKGLGKYLADLLRSGDKLIPDNLNPSMTKETAPANWLEKQGVMGLFKQYGCDDLEDVLERVWASQDSKVVDIAPDGQNIVEMDMEGLNIDPDVLELSEQIQAFNIHFEPKES